MYFVTHTGYCTRIKCARNLQRQAQAAAGRVGGVDTGVTERILQQMDEKTSDEAGGAGGGLTLQALRRVNAQWINERDTPDGQLSVPRVVAERSGSATKLSSTLEYDVVVCGGTLGIIFAVYLQQRGHRVAVVERSYLKGREQEWNISRKEFNELVHAGVLTHDELEHCIVSEFNPVRCGFNNQMEVHVHNVLNTGVSPYRTVHYARQRFETELAGDVFEQTSLSAVETGTSGASINVQYADGSTDVLTTRLVLDCMGHQSPIMRQVRQGKKPEGGCLVVGSCCDGFSPQRNTFGDLIYSCTDIVPQLNSQPFWEAFPAEGAGSTKRTSYFFNYMDLAATSNPSLFDMLEEYWKLMPQYQGVDLNELSPQRVLFGYFPTWLDSPLKPGFDRVLQVADASGIQSPLSFGGFGALTRHLERVAGGIHEALEADALDKRSLASINAYMPNTSAAWLFQQAMSIRHNAPPQPDDFINRVLSVNFRVMQRLGNHVLYPFLQDVPQFAPLAQTIAGMVLEDPLLSVRVTNQLGARNVVTWLQHFLSMAGYEFSLFSFSPVLSALEQLPGLSKKNRFELRMLRATWKFGSGKDYSLN